jgi:hypothetical protein
MSYRDENPVYEVTVEVYPDGLHNHELCSWLCPHLAAYYHECRLFRQQLRREEYAVKPRVYRCDECKRTAKFVSEKNR